VKSFALLLTILLTMCSIALAGNLIITQFVSAPFPHPSRAEGHKYKDEILPAAKHYSDSNVALFVPDCFKTGNTVDFVVHFHGWRNNVTNALVRFKPLEMFSDSQRNAVFILPQGPRDAPDSSCGKLEDADGFKRFIEEAIATLSERGIVQTNSTPGRIILSGHSGGYQVMSSIVERGGLTENIREVWLFDALYARGEKFLAWSDKTGGRLLNIYTDGGGTKLRTVEMMTLLKERGTNFVATTDALVSKGELAANRFVFLHTDMTHNDVFAWRKTFQTFLETSCLEKTTKD
jgi:hypothetical protein